MKEDGWVAGRKSFEGTERQGSRQQIPIYSAIVAYPTPASSKMVQMCFLSRYFLVSEWWKLYFHIIQRVGARNVCAVWPFSGNSVCGGTVLPSLMKALPLCIFPALCLSLHIATQSQRRLQPEFSWHTALRALRNLAGLGKKASKFTRDIYRSDKFSQANSFAGCRSNHRHQKQVAQFLRFCAKRFWFGSVASTLSPLT